MRDPADLNYWSLSPKELASRLVSVAQADSSEIDGETRYEAGFLAKEWHEATQLPQASFGEQQRKVALLSSLQKRIIEILVRTQRSADPSKPPVQWP